MPFRVPSKYGGFTLFELLVVVCIIAVLAGSLLGRTRFYQEEAEKAAMQQVVGALQSALAIRIGSLMINGKIGVATLAAQNPMDWLAKKPDNYEGEFYDPAPQSVPPGSWMFDLKSHNLIYVVDRSDFFTPGKDGVKWIRYRVNLEYEQLPGRQDKVLVGVALEPVDTYRWFDRRLR